MFKTAILGSMLLSLALSTYVDIDNNLIEYELSDIQPMQTIIKPYPYNYRNKQHIYIEPISTPVHSSSHSNIFVPSTAVEVSSPGFVSTIISCSLTAVKKVIGFILSKAPALVAGTIIALGICKMTSLCGGSDLTIVELQRELRSIATPDAMASVTNYVKEAIRKYSEMQV